MNKPMILASGLALSLILSAAAGAAEPAPAKATESAVKSAVKSEEKSGTSAKGNAAAVVNVSKVTATVEAIDLPTRTVTLTGPKGKSVVLEVSKEVRNLDQVKVGDKVSVEFYEGITAEIKDPSASTKDVKLTDAAVRAAPGERPNGGVGTALTATVEIEFVDSLRHIVHFKGPAGKTRIVKVEKPEFRKMLKKLKAGDKVELTFFEALAIKVTPAK